MLTCYNRGCGKTYNPNDNNEEDCIFLDSCLHHPGFPFFHDAYKSWTCCNKRSVDFTEFLNIKGCTLSKHSNEKPLQPEKPKNVSEEETEDKIITAIRPSMQMLALNRPSLDSSLKTIEPIVSEVVKKQFDSLPKFVAQSGESNSGFVNPGTICKNGGCNFEYIDYCSNDFECIHHPGVPIFHEGLKYWSCCQKKTSDFTAFMNQLGCTSGKHKWLNEDEEAKIVKCRWDWHQTAANVIISIYAKLYDYQTSKVQVNPIRLICNLKFPQQGDSEFNIDLELRGIIDVDKTVVQMLGSKIEILMPKAETGTWANLDFPKKRLEEKIPETHKSGINSKAEDSDSDIDLDDIEPARGVQITNLD